MDDLLHLLHSDGADELRLRVGQPPVLVMDGEPQQVEGPALSAEDTWRLWQGISTTRERRALREQGTVEFIHQFRGRACFVVHAAMDGAGVGMDIH